MESAVSSTQRRDIRVISVIGLCHFFSHFYQFVLPPLSILVHQAEGYSLESLALLVSVFYAASFILQVPVGFFVDRFGARGILIGGTAVLASCTLLYGVYTSYPALVILSIIAGAANSVYHPADYSILSASVNKEKLGRAFGTHNFAGFAGYATAPILVAWLGSIWGWQNAAIITGGSGLVFVVFVIFLSRDFEDSSHRRRADANSTSLIQDGKMLLKAPLLLFLLFFTLLSAGQLGAQWFADDVLNLGHGIPVVEGNSYVSVFVIGIALGILGGGIAADKSKDHIRLAVMAFAACGLGTVLMGFVPPDAFILYPLFVITGFLFGFGFASRDMLVRSLAPAGASGAVFGFVFSGLDIGAAIIPLVYGYFLGVGLEFYVFYLGGVLIFSATAIIGIARKNFARSDP